MPKHFIGNKAYSDETISSFLHRGWLKSALPLRHPRRVKSALPLRLRSVQKIANWDIVKKNTKQIWYSFYLLDTDKNTKTTSGFILMYSVDISQVLNESMIHWRRINRAMMFSVVLCRCLLKQRRKIYEMNSSRAQVLSTTQLGDFRYMNARILFRRHVGHSSW